MTENLFQSFLMGGFECSTHRRGDRRRLDVIAATEHDVFARADYQRLLALGLVTMRDGARWHLIERTPYHYDFASLAQQVAAARTTGAQIIWDVFHYGYPDDLDIMSDEFINRFAAFARALTAFLIAENVHRPLLCLINEISFFAWIAGEVGLWQPYLRGQGDKLKLQLVRAHLAAAAEIRKIAPHAVFVQTDPAIRVLPEQGRRKIIRDAANYHASQYAALDATLGQTAPELGGNSAAIDIIGLNYYQHNQWWHPSSRRIELGNPDYQAFRFIIADFYQRYGKPLFIAETGIENEARPAWFRYICEEVRAALEMGIPVLGLCLYPIVNHPGWDDNRHCHNGLWDYPNTVGERGIYSPLAAEVARQSEIFARMEVGKAEISSQASQGHA